LTVGSIEVVKLGEILDLNVGKVTVRTKLQEMISDSEFVVLQPTLKGVPVRAEDGEVTCTFYRPTGCFSFSAHMFEPFRKGELSLCRIERISEIKRLQRRQYYRLPIVLDLTLYDSQAEDKQNAQRWHAKSINLSEKAIAISCFSTFADGTPLTLDIELMPSQIITWAAVVLRGRRALRPTDPNEYVLLFVDQDVKVQSFLRRFIFRQQTLKRKKNNEDN